MEDVPDMAVKFAVYESLRPLHHRLFGGRQVCPRTMCYIDVMPFPGLAFAMLAIMRSLESSPGPPPAPKAMPWE
jgi:hypothetical protein